MYFSWAEAAGIGYDKKDRALFASDEFGELTDIGFQDVGELVDCSFALSVGVAA